MNSRTLLVTFLACAGSACSFRHGFDDYDHDSFCWESSCEGSFEPAEWEEEATTTWDEPEECFEDGNCSSGNVCDAFGACIPVVQGCGLTPVCLADPPGYTPPPVWRGIDPAFAGSLRGSSTDLRVSVVLDFYEDHAYGEGVVSHRFETNYQVLVTANRVGNHLQGQIVPAGGGRQFDAVFEADLLSGSEISGTFSWWDDEGTNEGALTWVRTSPCGCETVTCASDLDCDLRESCVNSACVVLVANDEAMAPEHSTPAQGTPAPHPDVLPDGGCDTCEVDADCDEGLQCVNALCEPIPPCASDSDCEAGNICDEGACLPAQCTRTCECEEGLECTSGRCIPREDPVAHCSDSCDCNFDGGERCVEGICQPSE